MNSPDPSKNGLAVEGLPKFPGSTDDGVAQVDGPRFPMPCRAKSWATFGAIAGGGLGGIAGGFTLLCTILEGRHLMAGLATFALAPLGAALLAGIGLGVRGAIADAFYFEHDRARIRDLERDHAEKDAAWQGIHQIMRQRNR